MRDVTRRDFVESMMVALAATLIAGKRGDAQSSEHPGRSSTFTIISYRPRGCRPTTSAALAPSTIRR